MLIWINANWSSRACYPCRQLSPGVAQRGPGGGKPDDRARRCITLACGERPRRSREASFFGFAYGSKSRSLNHGAEVVGLPSRPAKSGGCDEGQDGDTRPSEALGGRGVDRGADRLDGSRHGAGPAAQPPAAPPPPEHPAIEPAALEMIQATSERLAGAKSMSFTAVATYKSPRGTVSRCITRRFPRCWSRARQAPRDHAGRRSGVGLLLRWHDDDGLCAGREPGGDRGRAADDRATIAAACARPQSFPVREVIVADPYKNISEGLTSAFVVGQSMVVGGTITDMVAFPTAMSRRSSGSGSMTGCRGCSAWSIPRTRRNRLRDRVLGLADRSQGDGGRFPFTPPANAARMAFARPDAPPQTSGNKGKP